MHSQVKVSALHGHVASLHPMQNGSEPGLSEAKLTDIVHTHRLVQMSSRGTESTITSEDRAALVPSSSVAARNSSSWAGSV